MTKIGRRLLMLTLVLAGLSGCPDESFGIGPGCTNRAICDGDGV